MRIIATKGRHARSESRRVNVRGPIAVVGVAIIDFFVAGAATTSLSATLTLAAGVALVAACVLWPAVVLAAAFPSSFAVWRVGPGALGMSIADVIAFVGAAVSLPHVPWHSKAFRRVLIAAGVYSAVVGVATIAHYSTSGAVEVVHRFVMVMGATCIGAAIVRMGKVTMALRALVIMATAIATLAVIDTLSNGLRPAYAWGLQKNASGSLLVSTIIVVFLSERHLRWPRPLTMTFGLVLMCGLAATQSRGAATALIGVITIYTIRQAWRGEIRQLIRYAPLVLLFAGALTFAMVQSFQRQAAEHQGENYKFGSVGSREVTYKTAWNEIIKPHPVLGIGPKWFNNPNAPGGEPHNFVLDELASDGVIGLAALAFLMWTCLHVLRGSREPLAMIAFYVVLARLIADLFDIFWVAGPNTLPFLIFGLGIGAISLDEEAHDAARKRASQSVDVHAARA